MFYLLMQLTRIFVFGKSHRSSPGSGSLNKNCITEQYIHSTVGPMVEEHVSRVRRQPAELELSPPGK